MQFEYGTKTIKFDVEYRNRKTLEIGIEPPEKIRVLAPNCALEEDILRIVKSKAKWITGKLFEFKDIEYRKVEKEYVNGESFMYLGRRYSLQIILKDEFVKSYAKLYRGKLYVETNTKDSSVIKKAIEKFYREKTLEKVLEKTEYYSRFFNLSPVSIKVKEQKKIWGSCSSAGDIFYNWRCSMAPSNVMDYIVVHEMCHMVNFNHSKEYWKLVETIMPDFRERKKWLRDNGVKMEL